jgi:putative thymidine phosphorylase
MQFKSYKIPIRTGNKFVAVLTPEDALKLDLKTGDRIKVSNPNDKSGLLLTAFIDISDDKSVKVGNIGLFSETFNKLKLKHKGKIQVELMEKPDSVEYIKAKLNGKKLTKEQINEIIKDVVEDDLTDVELTYLVSGCYMHGLSDQETADLTRAIVNNGKQLTFTKGTIVDKHCIGGVPGNRTTLIIVPIIAAAGLKIPKTSSRSITSPSGTADTMEVLANVTVQAEELKKIATKINGFISWGGGVDIAAADDHIIRVRHPLSLDPEGMMIASIMAKKFAAGSKKVLIDIPVGPTGKIKTTKEARHLKNRFEKIGKLLDMDVRVIFTDGTKPIGKGIGPSLEAIDVIKVLHNLKDAPADLREKSLKMAGILLEMGGKAAKNKGYALAEKILTSGKAKRKFEQIIQAQGPSKLELRAGKYNFKVDAEKSGTIKEVNNKLISKIARMAGAPIDKYAGILILKTTGDKVKKGDILFEVYSDSKSRLEEIQENFENPYLI